MGNVSEKQTPGTTSGIDADESAELYEVDEILDMRPRSKRASNAVKYLVSWVGFEDRTWEPVGNLPVAMVAEYRTRLGYANGKSAVPSTDATVCATCGDGQGDLGSACTRCNKPMHQVCASDVCIVLDLKNKSGQAIADFPDGMCYCSSECYHSSCTTSIQTLTVGEGADIPVCENGNAAKLPSTRVEGITASEEVTSIYEVEAIVDMDPTSIVGGEDRYLVSWVGFTEQTWEPAKNLPAAMVSEYRQLHALEPEPATPAADSAVCATCGDGPEGLGSACARCNKPMHHFCASDVCKALSLKASEGQYVVEFPNDICFCSRACYEVRTGAVRAAKMKRVRRSSDSSESDYNDEEERAPLKKVKTRLTQPAKKKAVKNIKSPKSTVRNRHDPSKDVSQPWPPPKPKPVRSKPSSVVIPKSRDHLVGKMVAFCTDKEDWMPTRLYKEAMGLFLSGRVFIPKRVPGERLANDVYEVRWTVTIYQTPQYVHRVKRDKIEEGIRNYATISGGTLNNATYRHICQVPESEQCEIDADLDAFVILEGSSDLFVSDQVLPENLELVEQIKSLDFQPTRRMQEPADLFTNEDGGTETKLIKEKRHHFETASSSFLAYLPLSFWRTVVCESNKYADSSKGPVITLDELLRFFGILFYMTIIDKGEYSNYWGEQVENKLFDHPDVELGLDSLMSLKRFQFIRKKYLFSVCRGAPGIEERSSRSDSTSHQHAQVHMHEVCRCRKKRGYRRV